LSNNPLSHFSLAPSCLRLIGKLMWLLIKSWQGFGE